MDGEIEMASGQIIGTQNNLFDSSSAISRLEQVFVARKANKKMLDRSEHYLNGAKIPFCNDFSKQE